MNVRDVPDPIGRLKCDYLHHSRTPQEIQLMRRLKQALDPRGILNPGRVIPDRCAGGSAAAEGQ